MSEQLSSGEPLKLGFIGGGLNSAIGSAHFCASMLDDRFRVVSGCFSRDKHINRATAKRWHVDQALCTDNWRDYLDLNASELDAIGILTPIPDHISMLMETLDRRIPVICEKALVSTREEAIQLRDRYQHQNPFLAVTLNYSGYPAIRLLRSLIAKGELGRIHQVHLEMPLENYCRIPLHLSEPAKPQVWRQTDGAIPTLLLDLGVHLHHLLHYLLESPAVQVIAQLNHFSSQPDIIDDARFWMECENDIQATMWMSKTALGHRNGMRVRVFGDLGSAEWYQFHPEVLKMTDKHGVRSELDRGVENDILALTRYNRFKAGHPSGYIEAFANVYWDIADSLLNYQLNGTSRHPDVFGLVHSINGLNLLHAAVESHYSRQWQKVHHEEDIDHHNNADNSAIQAEKVA